MSKQIVTKKLSQNQELDILAWLYRYRFSTCSQFKAYLVNLSYRGVQKKLKKLEDQNFIGKCYDKHYKFAGRPAEYFLTPKGAKYLKVRSEEDVDDYLIKSLYKNKKASDDLLAHGVHATDAALAFRSIYGDVCSIFTKIDMAVYEYFPKDRPDLLLSIKTHNGTRQFFVDIFDDTKPFFVMVRKIRKYIKYMQEDAWPSETFPAPTILIICEDIKVQKKLRWQIQHALEEVYDDKTVFALTTKQGFYKAQSTADEIWEWVTFNNESRLVAFSALLDDENL